MSIHNKLLSESMKLEGERFKLFRLGDKAFRVGDMREYANVQKEIYGITVRLEQYGKVLKEFQGAKRKGMR